MLLYYITDRKQLPVGLGDQCAALLRCIARASAAGVDYIQLREKDLPIGVLERLASEARRTVREHSSTTRLLINSRTDIALAVRADGVHLTSSDISASDARAISAVRGLPSTAPSQRFLVSASCHSIREVRSAEAHGADFVVLAPIFEKSGVNIMPLGLSSIRSATLGQAPDLRVEAGDNRIGIPVLALGGVTLVNAPECIRAGAAGIAGIRLFQQERVVEVVCRLRDLESA